MRRRRKDGATARFAIKSFDQIKFESIAKTLAQSKTWICPTMFIYEGFTRLNDTASLMQDTVLKYFPDFYINKLRKRPYGTFSPLKDSVLRNSQFEMTQTTLRSLYKAGVKILPGTDTPGPGLAHNFPGFSLQKELQLLVEAGMKLLVYFATPL